ncbi:DUF1353 domain-containing protein [Aeromonas salmonicida]|uniref:DUF1353 domain-containing protein n=1 Tax=Aeromonas salmonicida TaxID=645 RepID=UPI0009BFECE2|nr:DUF1353 domain-containing protein [Aeromonas salmonicida]
MKIILRNISFLFFMLITSTIVFSEENFGDFLGNPKGVFDIHAKPRPTFKLDGDFRFRDPNGVMWVAPSGTEVDGASIPQAFWSLIGGPFEGPYISASVIHDYFCQTKEKTAHDTHRNFYYGMRATNVPEWKASLMYWVVNTFGPSWILERRIVMKQKCTDIPKTSSTCISTPSIELIATPINSVDLSDPVTLSAAVIKTNAVARTLLTSNGKYFDITDNGVIPVTEENIINSAKNYRKTFVSKEFYSSPARLGILSQANGKNIAEVNPWPRNEMPSLSKAIVLTTENILKIENEEPFKLEPQSKNLIQGIVDLKLLKSTTIVFDKAE